MTILTTCICDYCSGDAREPAFTVKATIVDVMLRMDFCTYECMRKYILEKWNTEAKEDADTKAI